MGKRGAVAVALAATLGACAADDPGASGHGLGGGGDGGDACPAPRYVEDVSACVPLAVDYFPRDDGSAHDAWPACISDGGVYHRIEPSVSSIARVESFERIADLLWRRSGPPSPQDFLDARVEYAVDQGLDSRVQRREDEHYPPPVAGACTDPGVPAANPDRCVGPARLLPILNDAFAAGARGEAPRENAARIEAALIWFLYVSAHKEAITCAVTPRDCDSSWAYYTGGTPREAPIGLAAYVDARGPATHDRAYDGTLAVRCWRNLDHETGVATDPVLQARAVGQLDRAMLRGVALIARERFRAVSCHDADRAAADLAFLRAFVPFLDREARSRDAGRADVLVAEAARERPADVDAAAAVAALDGLFPCP
jgi:hypothetical protein